ncbi:MAG TPA: NAD(P)-dependent alcohol dehydrogenase [Methylomirabilota bacterium]|jgi:NADPH:quinone reductase-like Zn-dependent oxidoreductase
MPTMKVMQIQDTWSPDSIVLAERPTREPGPGEVQLRMAAASLNYRDYVMSRGGYGRRGGALPLIPCSDGAGRVVAVGAGVSRVAVGDLVCPIFTQTWWSGPFREAHWSGTLGGPRDGVMQELMVLSQEGVVRAPRHLDAVQAATLPCAAVTAWHAVVAQGRVKAGDVVLVQGTGGVSLFALLFAKMHGARVLATSSSDAKLERVRAMGADHVVNYKTNPDWHKVAREVTGGVGVDLVVEVAGTLDASVRAVRTSGTLALIGVLAGATAQLGLGAVVTQNIRLQGVTVGSRELFEDMVRAMELHGTVPPVDERLFAFEEVASAIKALPAGQHFGKVCSQF